MSIIQNSLRRRVMLFSLVGFSAYWFATSVLWIPWVINKWLGITVMIILAPFLWWMSSLYCLKHIPIEKYRNNSWLITGVFLAVAIISDFFFFAIWRGIPEQLYHPTTFATYGLIFIVSLLASRFINRSSNKVTKIIYNKNLTIIGLIGVIFFIITLYSVRFW